MDLIYNNLEKLRLNHIILFYRIMRCGSFEKVAIESGKNLEEIYQSLKYLKKHLEYELYFFSNNKILLTQKGKVLFLLGRRLHHCLLAYQIRKFGFVKEFYISTSDYIADLYGPEIILQLRATFPNTKFVLLTNIKMDPFKANAIDAYIGCQDLQETGFVSHILREEKYSFFMSSKYRQKYGMPVYFADFLKREFILYKDWIPEDLKKLGLNIIMEIDSFQIYKDLSAKSLGITLLPTTIGLSLGLTKVIYNLETMQTLLSYPFSLKDSPIINGLTNVFNLALARIKDFSV